MQSGFETVYRNGDCNTEIAFKLSHARLEALKIIVPNAARIHIKQPPQPVIRFPQYKETLEGTRQQEKEPIERMKNAFTPVIQAAIHTKGTRNRQTCDGHFKEGTGSLLKAF